MVENIKVQISQKETELEQIRAQGEIAYQQYLKYAGDFLKDWYVKTARGFVSNDLDNTKELGKRLGEMKNKILNLNSEEIISKLLVESGFLWHTRSLDEFFSQPYENDDELYHFHKKDKRIEDAFHSASEILRTIVSSYGYRIGFPSIEDNWTSDMERSMESYSNLYSKARNVIRELSNLKYQLKKQQAEEMWDQV